MNIENVIVKGHALDQWRIRVSQYADAKNEEVIETVKKSRKIPKDEYLPFNRKSGYHYYYHEETKSYFVAEPVDKITVKIVTVIVPDLPKNFINPKQKNNYQILLKPEESKPPKKSENEIIPNNLEIDKPEPTFAHISEEREWLITETKRIEDLLKIYKKGKTHEVLSDRVRSLHNRLRETREKYFKWIEENNQIYRNDGTINIITAVKFLLEENNLRQKEITVLKKISILTWISMFVLTIMSIMVILK